VLDVGWGFFSDGWYGSGVGGVGAWGFWAFAGGDMWRRGGAWRGMVFSVSVSVGWGMVQGAGL